MAQAEETRSEIAQELLQLAGAAQALAGRLDVGAQASEALSTGVRHLSRRAARAPHQAAHAGRRARRASRHAGRVVQPAAAASRRAANSAAKRLTRAEKRAVGHSKQTWPLWTAVAAGAVAFAVGRLRRSRS